MRTIATLQTVSSVNDGERARASLETKRAMFWAALVAECANEPYMTVNRIVTSLLRTDSVLTFCTRAQVDTARVRDALQDPHALSFEECERRVMSALAARGVELGSAAHRASVQLRPVEAVARPVFDRIIERYGHMAVSPLELLLDLIRADPALADLLVPHGLTADAIQAVTRKR